MPELKRVIIGSEYKAAYDSLVKILQSGRVENTGAHVSVDSYGRKVICTEMHEYVYDDSEGGTVGGNGMKIAMDSTGASWFAPMREGKTFDDGTSEWKQLIFKVAQEYHKQYSIIEYKQCDGSENTDTGDGESNIRKIVSRLFNRQNISIVKGEDKKKGSEDIYGASVKLELGGTGQSRYTVMCKIFFRRSNAGITPLTGGEAFVINSKLEEAKENTDPVTLSPDDKENINKVTVNAVRELVNGHYPVSFKDSLCFSTRTVVNPQTGRDEDNYDLKTYKTLAERAVLNNAPITCTSVQVLGISHIKWINNYYEISFDGKVYLQAVLGFGGSVSLRCMNCTGSSLVISNGISYSVPDENEPSGKRLVNVVLDLSRRDLGLTDEQLKEIRTYSELANHMLNVTCPNNMRIGRQCSACVCRCQTVEISGQLKCANCPSPEEIYTDYSDDRPVRYLTRGMTFVNDKLSLVLADKAQTCSRCGRSFSASALTRGTCKLCSDIDSLDGERSAEAKKRYRKYRNMFAQTTRIKHMFHAKYCLEDDTTLLFALGRDRYLLSKLDLKDTGFVVSPKKIN